LGLLGVAAGKFVPYLKRASVPDIVLLVLLILVIAVIDIIMTGALPKWAILAPIFVPLFMRLGIAPQTVLAAYRVGDSPLNVITPLMVYLPFVVLIAQKYVKSAGLGTIIALMIPYTIFVLVAWIILFIVWFALGIPLGPGYPVTMP
jgi:aminobenzoyl-glutamate transport protein